MYLFELQFCLDICPGVGLPVHMATLLLVFLIIKAMVFAVVMYGSESWTVKKAGP